MHPTDEQLQNWCRRLRASDRDAYEQVFRALHEALFRYAAHLTGDAAAARDIVQDVFIALWDARERLEAERSLEALLYRMARNKAFNRKRNRRTRARRLEVFRNEQEGQGTALPDAQLAGDMLNTRLRQYIDELPERRREALLLSRFDEMSHENIAAVMDISPRTVNNHIVRALKQLRDRLEAIQQTDMRQIQTRQIQPQREVFF